MAREIRVDPGTQHGGNRAFGSSQTGPDRDLFGRYSDLKAAEPMLRARDAAARLGVGEGELVAMRAGRGEVCRLALGTAEFAALVQGLREVGPVMTLTRNEAAVHETHGTVDEVAVSGAIGQVVGPIDLRLFLSRWHVGFEVTEEVRSGLRRSLQVFDQTGTSVLKVYAVDGTDSEAWDRLCSRHRHTGEDVTAFAPASATQPDPPDDEIDREALREGWRSLEHSHDFHRLLRSTGAGREQALRLAGDDLARRVEPGTVRALLDGAAAAGVPIMCFVGNQGCIQIYSGEVHRIVPKGPWLNVLDPAFNLHLRTDLVASAWVVVKPTRLRGPITSLELFDAGGTLVCQFFGARPRGEGEREEWRSLVSGLAEASR